MKSVDATIRVLPELRSQQVKNHSLFTPARALYLKTNFDLIDVEIPDTMTQESWWSASVKIATSQAKTLELPEPLWARFLPTNLCLAAAWTLGGLARGRVRRARAYAIENNDALVALFGPGRIPRWAQKPISFLVGVLVRAMYERLAYGSAAAAKTYTALPFVAAITNVTMLELPGRPSGPVPKGGARRSIVFVGQLTERKGVRLLLEAWRQVETELPDAKLVIVGGGPLHNVVMTWAEASPLSRIFVGQLPNVEVQRQLPEFSVLVAPSIPWGRWREQIGLPIKDALSAGLTVVTTSETGLAPWLEDQGHAVVAADFSRDELAQAIIRAAESPLEPWRVVAALPDESRRVAADWWLHEWESSAG